MIASDYFELVVRDIYGKLCKVLYGIYKHDLVKLDEVCWRITFSSAYCTNCIITLYVGRVSVCDFNLLVLNESRDPWVVYEFDFFC